MTRVKVCGLTREEDVDAAIDAGADAVGFISGLPNSPRNVEISRAASLMARVPPLVTPVLVTTGDALVQNSDLIKRMAPKAIQLYGSPFSPETVKSTFHSFLLRPFLVGRQEDGLVDPVPKAKEAARGYDALLTDTYSKGMEGGTGLTSDWTVCSAIRRAVAPVPLILSGGLRPENVEAAISAVMPYCVDVSSGVESAPGVKDHSKLKAFIAKASVPEESKVAR
ncbi:MAG TPA: phosphoribosylanthranilate isomerase [Nitrososphaerales archaeon]|nr:phosphoribosylanthranilate isomerase [Nitrososphaerales archaeon]